MAPAAHPDSGVYMVPAFTGGRTHWDRDARAADGLTRDSPPNRTRGFGSIAYQTRDLFEAMAADGAAVPTRFGSMADSHETIGRCSSFPRAWRFRSNDRP